MASSTPERPPFANSCTVPNRLPTGLLRSVKVLVVLCAKKAAHVTKKLKWKPSPGTMLARPKNVLKTVSLSAMTLFRKKKTSRRGVRPEGDDDEEEKEWGRVGVWQRGILMGDKCQPLDFPGVIYYDSNGNKVNEAPFRSPRASPLPGYLLRKPEA
ncbi:uncharacterized protein LOC111440846 [Cucurbita moschata]|uniref:Uncharacterized protein LOC111440846 n=1 Tax=Cucurbita moschata TaxID=3662 RepID=A0A6J1EZ09_CUCMO|nr:uncharacterized protein LOC111440846 [Cucurbita moschata]